MNQHAQPWDLWSAIINRNTPGRLAYLLAGMPLGVIYFAIVIALLAAGIGLTPVVIGLPVLMLLFLTARKLGALELQLGGTLLGLPAAPPLPQATTKGFWRRFKELFFSGVTWKAILFLVAKLPLGIVSFTLVVALLTTSAALLLAPILMLLFPVPFAGMPQIHLGGDQIIILDPVLAGVLLLIVGVGFSAFSLLLLNGLAVLYGHFMDLMLTNSGAGDSEPLSIG